MTSVLGVLRAGLTRRALLGRGAQLALGGAIAGCGTGSQGQGAAPGGAGARPTSAAPVSIRIGERSSGEEQAFDQRLPVFKERFPHITVERDKIEGDLPARVRALLASNSLPDVVHTYTEIYWRFAWGGALLKLDDRIARDRLDLKQWFPELIGNVTVEGSVHGLPFKGQAYSTALFYNSSLFEARGLGLPTESWTLDDLLSAARQLTRREGSEPTQWGYAIQALNAGFFIPNARQWGADCYSPDGKRAVMDTPQMLECLQWHEALLQKERVMHPLPNATQAFQQGKVAMIGRALFGFAGSLVTSVGDNFKWGAVIMPKNAKTGKRGGNWSGDIHAVARQTAIPDPSFELLKFITDKEFGVALGLQTRGSTTLGGRPDVYEDPRILNHPQSPRQVQLAQVTSVKETRETTSRPWNFRVTEVEQLRDPFVAKIMDGSTAAEAAALRELNASLQQVLDQPRAL